MALDAPTRALLDAAAKAATKPRHEMSPAEARQAMARIRSILGPGPVMAREDEFVIPVAQGRIRAHLLAASAQPRGAIVYFHGGGWVVGELEDFSPLCRHLAAATGCAVIAVEYRKAPEHHYPGPVEDAWQAYLWVLRSMETLFHERLPVLVGGDSAGGNLAIAVTLRARESGRPPAGQVLFYPVTDCDFDRPSYQDPANQLLLTRETMKWYWDRYVPDTRQRREAEASPILAADLSDLPPAIVLTAEHDVLLDEGLDYARRLSESGVRVFHHTLEGQIHAFLMMIDVLPGSAAGLAILREAFDRLWPDIVGQEFRTSRKGRTEELKR